MSEVLEHVRSTARLGRAYFRLKSWPAALFLARNGVDIRYWQCEMKGRDVYFPELGFALPAHDGSAFIDRLDTALLLTRAGVRFITDGEAIIAHVKDLSIRIETAEELQILEEVFVSGVYNFSLSGPLLIFDVGMNAGVSSLFFASMYDAFVYGFEPLLPTIEAAKRNIALNPAIAHRISLMAYGLSDRDQELTLDYDTKWRGSVGVYGVPAALSEEKDRSSELVELRDAAAVLDAVCNEHPTRRVIIKLDCEGSEYSIVERFLSTKAFQRVELMMIECHKRVEWHDPEGLKNRLENEGFGCIHLDPNSPDISMLYAVRTSRTNLA